MPILNNSAQQTLVDDRFHGEAPQWCHIYDQPGLIPDIYRLRRDLTIAAIQRLGFPGARVLEIGCGAGLVSVTLAKQGYQVTATDRLDAMLRLTRDRAESVGVRDCITTRKCDVYELPFPPESFHVVVAVGVLPWLDFPEKALLEIVRVLSHSGRVIVTTDNKWSLTTLFDPLCSPLTRPARRLTRMVLQHFKIVARSQKPVLHLHSPSRIDDLLLGAGLEKSFSTTIGFGPLLFLKHPMLPPPLGVRMHAKLQCLADRGVPFIRSGGIEYLVVARRSMSASAPLHHVVHTRENLA
jgi:ubiquinone/menaquinone biosynthesis C-methylase UbiE